MQQTEVDGVTTLWEDLPGPFTASLIFGVGARDTTFRTAQLAHLVEHLALVDLPKTHVYWNGSVDLDCTDFISSGDVDEVAKVLAHVCRNLASPPLHEVQRELRVLAREDSSPTSRALSWAMARRHGLRGPGVTHTRGAGDGPLTDDVVRAFISRYFVQQNAVLVLSQPPPAPLRLDLPSGARNVRAEVPRTGGLLPGLIHGETPHAVLSFELPDAPVAVPAMMRILDARILEEARHRRGLIYDTNIEAGYLGVTGQLVAVDADSEESASSEVLHIMWTALNDLATNGPSAEELDLVRKGYEAYLDDITARFSWLEGRARTFVYRGELETEEELRSRYERLDASQVRDWAAFARRTTLAGVPEPLREPLVGLPDLTAADVPPTFTGERFGRRLSARAPLGIAVSTNDAGISNQWSGGAWDDVVAVGSSEDLREVIFADGRSVLAVRRHIRSADRLFAHIDRHVGHLAFVRTLHDLDEQ